MDLKKAIRNARYRAAHAVQISAQRKEHRAKHHERILAREAQYKTEHPEVLNANTANYKNRKRAGGGSFSRVAWAHLKVLFGQRCAYCGERGELTQDHIVPVSKGGWHFSGNIVPACRPCNSSKGNVI